jgi:hypothetical protein
LDNPTFDNDVRWRLFQEFVTAGEPPSSESLAARLQAPLEDVRAALERLAAGKAIVLQPESREILMANPLCAVPTPFRVRSRGRAFFGSCVWDAMGIVAMLGGDAILDTSCGCCGEAMALTFRGGDAMPALGVIHFAIPARRWWENIVFT